MIPFARIANFFYGAVLQLGFRASYSPKTMRRNLDWVLGRSAARIRAKYGLTVDKTHLNGVPAEILARDSASPFTLLYLHGGGYFMGSLPGSRENAAKLVSACGGRAVAIDYRLSPENPHPAALEDAVRAYQALRERDPRGGIILCGDSAGGGLTLALALYLRDHQLPPPAGLICISPWTDLTGSGRSIETRRSRDVWLDRRHLESWAPWYYGVQDPKTPYISPVFGDFKDLPPMLLLVGDQEVLLDDSSRVVEAARTAGVAAELHLGRGMQHNWMLGMPFLKESKRAWDAISEFANKVSRP